MESVVSHIWKYSGVGRIVNKKLVLYKENFFCRKSWGSNVDKKKKQVNTCELDSRWSQLKFLKLSNPASSNITI